MRELNRFITRKLVMVLLSLLMLGSTISLLADGLPSEYYVTQRWRDLFAGHSPATNPAFMTEEDYLTTRMALCPTINNTFLLMELGAIMPLGLYQSLGISYLGLSSSDDIKEAYFDPDSNAIVETGKMVNDNQNLFILSYAVNPFGRFSVGLNANVYHKSNFDSSITGASIDLGLSYRLLRHPFLGDHVFGVNFQNLLSPDFQFTSWMRETANLKVSWLARVWESRIEMGLDLDIKDFMSQASDFTKEGSGTKVVEYDFNFRAGLWLMRMLNIYVQAGSGYWGVSPGMNVPSINGGRDLQVAYQFMSVIDDIDINSSHTFYFRGDFGKHREEIYARKMAREASVGPTVLYNKARSLYAQEKYWDAFFVFGKILIEYPDFFKNDWVQLHMGLCQEKLDMRVSATENYERTKKEFPRSKVTHYADLGLLYIAYRNNDRMGVANQFAKINSSTVPDTIKGHAYYYMGLQHMKDKAQSKAVQLFDLVPQNHPEHIFALYSRAVAYAGMNKISQAVTSLQQIVQKTSNSKEEKEIVNRSLVLLGYIYFEGLGGTEQSLKQAVAALRKIPSTSYYYEDAQLGLAWSALKAGQHEDCIKACDEIVRLSKKDVLHCEAMLLKGYTLMVIKQFTNASSVLRTASDLISKTNSPSQNDLTTETNDYRDNRKAYDEIALSMNDLGFAGQSSFIIGQIDSLHTHQIDYEKKIRTHHRFVDEFSRTSFFSKSIDKLSNDIEYALAKAEKMSGEEEKYKVKDSAGKEINKIDDEMKKLQDQLKELENND